MSKIENRLYKLMGRAINQHTMIEKGDRILIAISGGKDSTTLADLFALRKKKINIPFEVMACHVIIEDFSCGSEVDPDKLGQFLNHLNIPLYIERMRIINEKTKHHRSQCFYCAWNRRKTLFQLADRLKCNKVALGHHKDDVIQTTLINLFYHGEISTMPPKLSMFNGVLTLIRPMCFIEEREIIEYTASKHYPHKLATCDQLNLGMRHKMNDLIEKLEQDIPNVKNNIYKSLKNIKEGYLT